MLEIKFIDGIPCITLEDGIICIDSDLQKESRSFILNKNFTEFQESKEKSYFESVLDELKKKFGEI
ncbi:MAG: hypothetical protein ACFE9Z_04475 [Promethearchaeota archaeon]